MAAPYLTSGHSHISGNVARNALFTLHDFQGVWVGDKSVHTIRLISGGVAYCPIWSPKQIFASKTHGDCQRKRTNNAQADVFQCKQARCPLYISLFMSS